eukprot:TRINITY_DN38635_c0_g1_i1.p1 TRINITY_DN38635_c0_g1~~TRINITY_DN38635_c0_g1_i1.p1  ORF type:complete len:380 (-),score=70.01 TRINITY_DN38635_c0_g1_i1:247-1386(-)
MGRMQLAAGLALLGISLAPLAVPINPNVNVIITACLSIYVGSWRSVKTTTPMETMSKEHAMRFPLIGSAVLMGLFLLFKFLPKDLVNLVLTGYFVVLGVLAVAATLLPLVEKFNPAKWNKDVINLKPPYFSSLEVEFTRSQLVATFPASLFCVWYVLKKHWLANNALGLAFSIQGIEMLSLGSFTIGAILLGGLFFYDIFWVFCTPVMVTVAKSFDAPIKLLFPTGDLARPFSLLGLGDIVIPGIFVALALRFDVKRNNGGVYFRSAFVGYFLGITLTILIMNWFQAAQPALLYIVPCVMGAVGITALLRGEYKALLEYDEGTLNAVAGDLIKDKATGGGSKENDSSATGVSEGGAAKGPEDTRASSSGSSSSADKKIN